MDIEALLIQNGIDVITIKQMIANKNYKELYGSYSKAIEFMCFVTSEYEFNDFISDHEVINEEAFLLALAATLSLCCCFGVNEEEEKEQYLKTLNRDCSILYNDCYNEGTYYIF